MLLRKASAHAPGGRLAVQEFVLSEGKVGPPGPVFFSVHIVAVTEGERACTAKEIAGMIRKGGFRKIAVDLPDSRGFGILRASLLSALSTTRVASR